MRESLAHKQMQVSILVQILVFGVLFGTLSSIQPLIAETYGRDMGFAYWFALIAVAAAPAAPINGWLVTSLGMGKLVNRALILQAGGSFIVLIPIIFWDGAGFWMFLGWSVTVFAMAGFTIGNLNALALEHLGHVAGMAASVMGAISTVGGATIGALIGQLYDGTALPLIWASCIASGFGAIFMCWMPREATKSL